MRNRAKTVILIIIIAFLQGSSLMRSQERASNFIIKAGAGANGNIYSSSFTQLPGYPSCCTRYANAFGFGGSAWAGAEYDIAKPFAGGRWRIELAMGYTGLSAGFSEKEYIGNIISGNEITRADVEYRIKPTISSFFVDQGFIYYPFEKLPVSIKAGFQIDFLSQKRFTQEAELLNAGDKTFRNGKTTTEEYSGNLPDAAGQLVFATIGLRYEIQKWRNFSLVPEMQFNYGLNNVVTSLNWKASSLRAGVTVNYRIPRPELPPPPPPPAAPLPEPPSEKPLAVNLGVKAGNETLGNMDTVFVTERQTLFISRHAVLPVVFYQKDSKIAIQGNNKAPDAESAQMMSLKAVVDYMNQKPDLRVKAYYSGLNDETPEMHESRIQALKYLLSDKGIDAGRLTIEKTITPVKDIKVSERADEFRNVRFEFADGTGLLYVYGDTSVTTRPENANIEVEPNINPGAEQVDFAGSVNLGGRKVYDLKPVTSVYAINGEFIKPNGADEILSIDCIVRDAEGKENSSNIKLVVKTKPVIEKIFENLTSVVDESKTSQFVLGYNDFDKADLSVVDREVLEKVRKSLANGETVMILPLTDNLGTREYNEKLAQLRLKAAIKLIGADMKNVQVVMPESYIFSNDRPEGRMLNRCVIVRLKN